MRPRHLLVLAVPAALIFTPAASAVVQAVDASVKAQVAEAAGDQPNSDLAFKDLNDTTATLPLTVEAHLNGSTESAASAAGALATFSDPRTSVLPNPEEFNLDLAGFSKLTGLPYTGRCESTETREITFTAEDIGAPDGSTLQAQSQFFLNGIMLLWADSDSMDLSKGLVNLGINVEQTRPGQEPQNVLSASLRITGRADGSAEVTADGALVVQNVTVIDLDSTTNTGPLHLVVIPSLGIPYTYPAQVGETFTLKATIAVAFYSQAGSGAAASVGAPPQELGSVFSSLGGIGSDFTGFVQNQAKSAPAPLKPLPQSAAPTKISVIRRADTPLLGLPSCGNAGIEAAVLAVAWGLWLGIRRR